MTHESGSTAGADGSPEPRGRRRAPWLRYLAVGVGVLLAVLLVGWAMLVHRLSGSWGTPYTGRDPLPFTQERWNGWLAPNDTFEGTRFLMIGDLLAKHALIGMTREQVVELLGPMQPPGYPWFGDCYYLGPEDHPLALDNAWLVLTFENEVVTAWEIATD